LIHQRLAALENSKKRRPGHSSRCPTGNKAGPLSD
jgi:hypothetical protein